jgi:hypothetical protein
VSKKCQTLKGFQVSREGWAKGFDANFTFSSRSPDPFLTLVCYTGGQQSQVKNMTQKKVEYLSYLLRLWQENGNEGSQGGAVKGAWRASLETPSGESHGFASLDDLFNFLRRQISGGTDAELGHFPSKYRTEDIDQN